MISMCLDSNTKLSFRGELLLQFYIALYISKNLCKYCHLPIACFCTSPFGISSILWITLYLVLHRGLYFCLRLLTIHITFPINGVC